MKILHLFYDLMNLYGDYGNVKALERALAKKGENVEVLQQSVGDELDLTDADIVYIGSGTERNQKVALEYLQNYKDAVSAALERSIVLATGNSFEMFGKKITGGKQYSGLGLFDFEVRETSERIVTDSVAEFEKFPDKDVIGFVNKASLISLGASEKPLFKVKQGAGNSDTQTGSEGIVNKNFYGTHIIGPLLIRNEFLAEYFAELAVSLKKT